MWPTFCFSCSRVSARFSLLSLFISSFCCFSLSEGKGDINRGRQQKRGTVCQRIQELFPSLPWQSLPQTLTPLRPHLIHYTQCTCPDCLIIKLTPILASLPATTEPTVPLPHLYTMDRRSPQTPSPFACPGPQRCPHTNHGTIPHSGRSRSWI